MNVLDIEKAAKVLDRVCERQGIDSNNASDEDLEIIVGMAVELFYDENLDSSQN